MIKQQSPVQTEYMAFVQSCFAGKCISDTDIGSNSHVGTNLSAPSLPHKALLGGHWSVGMKGGIAC